MSRASARITIRAGQARGDQTRSQSAGVVARSAAKTTPAEIVLPTQSKATRAKRGVERATAPPAKLVAGHTRALNGAAASAKAKTVPPKSNPKSSKPLGYADRPMDELWREYRANPTRPLKNFLTEKYLDIVRYTSERMHKRLPSEVELDDLSSAGVFGLMDAIDAFDPDRGFKFETFCTQRISGAILDHLRAMDWVPRLVRSRTAKVEKIRRQIEMEIGRKATDREVADRMGVDPIEFAKLGRDSRPVGVVSLSRKWFETDSSKDVREIDVIRDNRQQNPVQLVQRQDLQTLITKGLSRAERLIVILYYYEEMTMKEIGMTLDLSESRVSQLHSQILERLKSQMHYREREFGAGAR